MSLTAIAWAWQQNYLTPPQRVVLFALADHHNGRTGQCNPGIDRLIEETGISRRGVLYHLTALEEYGLVERERRQIGYRRTSNAYLLSLWKTPDFDRPIVPPVAPPHSATGCTLHREPEVIEPEVIEELRSSSGCGAVDEGDEDE